MDKIYLAFHKPFLVVSQFAPLEDKVTLSEYLHFPEKPKAVGRLDHDSEGLLLLSNDEDFIRKYTNPNSNKEKEYWVQVENIPNKTDLIKLEKGLKTTSESYLPCKAELIEEPSRLWSRTPPIRFRKNIPTAWVKLIIREGKNRQVRKMTAFIGFPTLRLIRYRIDKWTLDDLSPGEWKIIFS